MLACQQHQAEWCTNSFRLVELLLQPRSEEESAVIAALHFPSEIQTAQRMLPDQIRFKL